jgi:hypothetical protein
MSDPAVSMVDGTGPFDDLSDYDRRNLLYHLIAADQTTHVHSLLALDGPGGANAWYELRRDHNEISSFLADIVLAKRSALQQKDEAVPLTIRYALMAASISSQADAIAPELLDAMVQAHVLSLDHALTMAREISSPSQRAIALALLGRHPDAPKGLDVEALSARDLVSRHQHLGEADQLAVDTQLLNILPVSAAAPHLGSIPKFDPSARRPPLHKLFARRFLTMQISEYPRVAEIFKRSDDVAGSQLLELINLNPQRPNVGRRRSGILAKLNQRFFQRAPKTRAGWELERLQAVRTRSPDAEEVAAALIGLIEAGVSIFQNLEPLALDAVRRIKDRDNKLLFLAQLAHTACDPTPVVAEVRSLLAVDPDATYAAAVAATAASSYLPIGEESEFHSTAVAFTLIYRLAHADRFRLQEFGWQLFHRTVLLARALAALRSDHGLLLSICAERCGVDENTHETGNRDLFAKWLTAVVKAHIARDLGGEVKDPGEWGGTDHVPPLEHGRNLAAVLVCVPLSVRRERLRAEYVRLTSALQDQPAVTAFTAVLAGSLPRSEGLELLRDVSTRAPDRRSLTTAIGTLAPDTEGLELLNSFDPAIVRPQLLQKLPLFDLLQFKNRVDAQPQGINRDELLTEISIAAFRSHGKDLFDGTIRRLTNAEMYSWTVEQVVRVSEVAPRGYGQRLEALGTSLLVPRKWDPADSGRSIASEHAKLWGAIARRDDLPDRDEIMRRALRAARQAFDHVRVETLTLVAPVLTAVHLGDIDRVIGAMERRSDQLAGLVELVDHAPDAVAKRYASKLLRKVIFLRVVGSADRRELAGSVYKLMPRLGVKQLRLLARFIPGPLGVERLKIEGRLAELGYWQEALKRVRIDCFKTPRDYLPILPYIPDGERARVVTELVEQVEAADRNIERQGVFGWCAALRPYLEDSRWEEMIIRCLRNALAEDQVRPSESQIQHLLETGESLLRAIPFDRLWRLVTEWGLDDRSRAILLRDISIIPPVLSANGRVPELMGIQRAIEDIVRWWPPEAEAEDLEANGR